MIFFSIGLPSNLAQTCDAVLLRLAEASLGSVALGFFNTLDDVAAAAIRSEAAHMVAVSRQPVVRLQTAVAQSSRPFVISLGNLQTALCDLLDRPGSDLPGAIRQIASSSAAMLTLVGAPGALVLSEKDQDDLPALAGSIARHFGFALGDHELRNVAASLDPAGFASHAAQASLTPAEQTMVDGALGAYTGYFRTGELAPMVWRPELFFMNESRPDQPPQRLTGAVDITGRARILVFGPYINLPPGHWSASVAIAFSAETAGVGFVVEVYAGAQLAIARVLPTGEQVVSCHLEFTIGDAVDQPVEIRVITERAAFDGRIALGEVSLMPRSGLRSETEQQLIQALHE